jgi:predicted PurR-regulated permease PerM
MRSKQIVRFLIGLIGVLIIGWLLWQVRIVGVYFAVATVLALMGRPLMKLLARFEYRDWKIPVWVSSIVVLLSFLFLIFLGLKFLTPVLVKQLQIIANLDVEILLGSFDKQFADVEEWFLRMNLNGVDRKTIEAKIASYLDFSKVGTFLKQVISGIGSVLIGFMSVLFITFFLLKDKEIINNIIDTVTPDAYLKNIHTIITSTKDLLSRYFIGVAIQVSIISFIVASGLAILGIPNALLIGFLAGLFNIIPYLGPIIGAAMGITLSLLSDVNPDIQMQMTPVILKILGVFAVAQVTDNFVLQPVIFSKSVKAHPLEIFVVIVAAGMVVGVVGMILAVPTYTFLRIVAKEFFQGYKVVQGLTKDL